MSKGSILVVDDESEIREGLELLLTSEGYGVSSASTGESGLAKLGERPYDLLLLDVSLPDRNGLDLLKEIHRRDPQLSVVLITAYGSIDMARAAFKNGAMDYITKPWSNDELLAQGRAHIAEAGFQAPDGFRLAELVGDGDDDRLGHLSETSRATRAPNSFLMWGNRRPTTRGVVNSPAWRLLRCIKAEARKEREARGLSAWPSPCAVWPLKDKGRP